MNHIIIILTLQFLTFYDLVELERCIERELTYAKLFFSDIVHSTFLMEIDIRDSKDAVF